MIRQFLIRFIAVTFIALAVHQPLWAAVSVTIDPKAAVSLAVGGTKKFTAKVSGSSNHAVTWLLTAPAGVSPAASVIGSLSNAVVKNGVATVTYHAPAAPLPGFAAVAISAASVAEPSAKAGNAITIDSLKPALSAVTPNPLPLGSFTLTVRGSKFAKGAQVLWNGQPLATGFVSATQLTATGTASQTGAVSITVANPGPNALSPAYALSVYSNLSVSINPASANLPTGGKASFKATVNGSPNQLVNWSVAGSPAAGSIDASGNYTAPSAAPPGGAATIYATAAADGVTKGAAQVYISDPAAAGYGRFLEQASYGPTPASLAHVKQIGQAAYLDEQFALPESAWPAPSSATTTAQAVDALFANALNGQDQLRQRVIGALSEIFVESLQKNTNGNEVTPWLQLLSRNAFGNYRTLLKEITLDASMGKFLDLVNSGVGGGAANENFPREVMQLFSLGLNLLNQDGSLQTDSAGQPIPTYTQADVRVLAKALTGWTYANAGNTSGAGGNYNYYPGPMIPAPGAHNTTAKTLLGQTIPANQTVQQDLDSAIGIIFNHPNVGPFVATRLIRALVTSNPSPAYISRVATVFNGASGYARGDMQATLKAILLDPEARNDSPATDFGRLRPPMQHTLLLCRQLGLDPGPAEASFAWLFYGMGEGLLDAPSVFGHYSPLFHIPGSSLYGPEFQIYAASAAINRANFFYNLIYNPWPINPVLQPLVNVAGDANALVKAVDNTLLYGRMLPQTRSAILNALPAQYDNNARVLTALYLTFTSGEYLVQH